jgi:hypothetical protein
MKRRDFITLLGGAAAAWPLTARTQQPATQHRIAIFHPAIPATLLTETGGGSAWRAFFAELRRLGYIEGENLIIERYSAEGHHERYADLAREIVSRSPDLIITGTNPVVTIFAAATSTIPIVAFMLDPLKAELVTSLSRPGGNLTGITLDPGIELWGKRLEMLKEAIPRQPRPWFWVCARDGKVFRDKPCVMPAADWESPSLLCSRRKGLLRSLSASSLRSSSNIRTPCWSAGKATFTRTAS